MFFFVRLQGTQLSKLMWTLKGQPSQQDQNQQFQITFWMTIPSLEEATQMTLWALVQQMLWPYSTWWMITDNLQTMPIKTREAPFQIRCLLLVLLPLYVLTDQGEIELINCYIHLMIPFFYQFNRCDFNGVITSSSVTVTPRLASMQVALNVSCICFGYFFIQPYCIEVINLKFWSYLLG